jgi:hypothetical protein
MNAIVVTTTDHGPNLFSQKCRAVQQQFKITGLVLFSSAVSQREENRGKKDFFLTVSSF